ncbi:hypothetical protein ACIREK_31170 [Streptomyces sp. NPDC102415]|uniref:hypothetical protein n=1 Tax=Streptomyces sp. NPDC102415 TaxID=3366173 RepID=UPI0038112C65
MSARDDIANVLWESVPSSTDDEAKGRAGQMLDAFRVEVIAARDAQIIAWLEKKAREEGSSNKDSRVRATAIYRLADKLSRGAVRPPLSGRPESASAEVDRLRAELAFRRRQFTPVEELAYDMDTALVNLPEAERRGANAVLQVLRTRAEEAVIPFTTEATS